MFQMHAIVVTIPTIHDDGIICVTGIWSTTYHTVRHVLADDGLFVLTKLSQWGWATLQIFEGGWTQVGAIRFGSVGLVWCA